MYDRKKLIVLRAALIAIGGIVGGIAVWQYFAFYPDVMRRELQTVVIVVSAAATALLLGLSAKPFYRLGEGIGAQFSGIASKLGVKGVTAVVAGLFAAGAGAFLFDVIIRDVIELLAVRFLSDVLVFAVFAALCCYGFTEWIAVSDGEPERQSRYVGYLLTASCFFDERVFAAAEVLQNVKVCDDALSALWKFGDDPKALERLKILDCSDAVGHVRRGGREFESARDYALYETKTAAIKRLRPVVCDRGAFPIAVGAVDLYAFSEPQKTLRDKFSSGKNREPIMPCADGQSDRETAANKIDASDDGILAAASGVNADKQSRSSDANGQIIIDK